MAILELKEAFDFDSMSRGELIDFIEEIYETDRWEEVEDAILSVTGLDSSSISDNGPEGFYTDIDTDDLREVAQSLSGDDEKTYSIELTATQINLVKRAMEAWSNPAFSKDKGLSRVAKNILSIL